MTRPSKRTSYQQGVYTTSATRKERVGTLRKLSDGRVFAYARAGAAALAAGKMSVAADISTNAVNKTGVAAAIGTHQLTLAITSSTFAEDYFKGGYLQVNDAAGEGHQYEITASSAVAASTAITISLEDGLRVAMTTASEFTLVQSRYMATIESADEENIPAGIPAVAVPISYYYWSQVRGDAIVLCAANHAVFSMLTLGATAGSVAAMSATVDVDMPIIGVARLIGVTAEYKPITLNIV